MLDVVFYQSIKELSEIKLNSDKPLVICPSPLVADGIRRLFSSELEIITISKWVSDHLKKINKKKSNKAELMLRLSSVWRHYFPVGEAEIFFRSFEVFTELRSFSLNLELLSEFLNELDEDIKKSVLIFWAFLESEKLIDEHKSYHLTGSARVERPIWLIGFKHLSGIQIDMLKEIGERAEVTLFFPRDVYNETLSSDWIRWIVPEKEIALDSIQKHVQVVYFPKNKLNQVLQNLRNKFGNLDVAILGQQPSYQFRQEVMDTNLFFKSPEDLFQTKREKFFEALSDSLRGRIISIKEMVESFEEVKKEKINERDFITYKIILLIEEALKLYNEFQENIDSFSVKVLKQIIELNSPRTSLATLCENSQSRLFEINELPYRESQLKLVLIASSNYGSLKGGDGKYSEKMLDSLRTIAPIKRAGLEFSYRKNELQQAMSSEGSILLIEEGLEQIDLSWREILNGFMMDVVNSETQYKLKQSQDFLKSKISPGPYALNFYSASRLQTYLDCPRKYYFNYIEKIDHRPEVRMKLEADEMGTLEHSIIRRYFESLSFHEEFNVEFLVKVCEQELIEFLSKSKVRLSKKTRLTTHFELLHYSQNGILYLLSFCKNNSAMTLEFEKEFSRNSWNLVGSIDCIVTLPDNHVALFDFKRSTAAIGSKKETMSFDKLQIWIYLLYLIGHEQKKIHTWGYLNLSELDESQIYEEAKSATLNDPLINNFQILVERVIEQLVSEVEFKPKPRAAKICKFCEVQLFCCKGEIE